MINEKQEKIDWSLIQEEEDKPKMVEVYIEQSWQNGFCYTLALDETEPELPVLLFAIISGSDSTLQSIKAAIDIGSCGLSFGYGEKTLTDYQFNREFRFRAEKGKYEKFPMTINNNKKALGIIHESLLGNDNYILSFSGDPAEDVRQVLGGGKYGLHILEEWKETVYEEFKKRNFIKECELYVDINLFDNKFSMLKLDLSEEEADDLISELIQQQKLQFPKEGTGNRLTEIKDLTGYMQTYVDAMIEKVSSEVEPLHQPLVNQFDSHFDSFKRKLFPVQAHVSTAVAKKLKTEKAALIQGEMSTGKTSMLVSVAESLFKHKDGYFCCVMVPPSLTDKWPDEIFEIIPNADVRVINKTSELIRFHENWTRMGRPKPKKPTLFVISFTTMRGDCAIRPVVNYIYKKTQKQTESDAAPYRNGYLCPDCGGVQHVIENTRNELNEKGEEQKVVEKRLMTEGEFYSQSRRLHNSIRPANAFCTECGSSLWTKTAPTRYSSAKEYFKYERKLIPAILDGNKNSISHIRNSQPEIRKITGQPRKIAAIEYIRRKMKNFFDLTIIDEIHELKSGMSAQGNALGSIVASSKKVIGGTGTLFGGKAEDIYYTLWRLFPCLMKESGYKFSEVRKWNEEFGNIETTTIHSENSEYNNKQSRGGTKRTEKVLPGISPFVFSKFLLQNTVLVRLVDVWPDPVELVNVPTILVDMNPELEKEYTFMKRRFETEIKSRKDGHKLFLPLTQTGISFPDNPYTYPGYSFKTEGTEIPIWIPNQLDPNLILNKERKLQEIISTEMSEGRKSIVYVRDTGSSKEGRDVRPRLKRVLEEIGAKVAILDTTTVKPNKRSDWLKSKIENERFDVVIVSQELVKVGLDLLCTPTLIFYQFSWSLFTINQASRRAWRIGQTEECRLFYLAYKNSFQEEMAQLIAMKNKATGAINGEVSSDGLNAMLGDDGDLQSLLVKSVKDGKTLKGSTEEWVLESSDRAREILSSVGKKKKTTPTLENQLIHWAKTSLTTEATINVIVKKASNIINNIQSGNTPGFSIEDGSLQIDLVHAFGMEKAADGLILSHLVRTYSDSFESNKFQLKEETNLKSKKIVAGQLTFDLF
ncbi:helicase-related protein [Bacillus swezeyi]|uniref:Helicase n=1 Tax=Bacillus swezeyi TaxID=1925020 RepID=A0A5M8RGH1_9BACI|nr:helicase-related protein [Bacillus swezeyi]KAA6446941.1 helicase [Bacillus swezeyi]